MAPTQQLLELEVVQEALPAMGASLPALAATPEAVQSSTAPLDKGRNQVKADPISLLRAVVGLRAEAERA